MALTAIEEINFLLDNPHFEERPASIREFLGTGYLDIYDMVRPSIIECLVDIFGEETNPERIAQYQRGQFTGAIGIGKTTVASIILPYMAHWILCMKDPQKYFNLLPGSRIAFMQMSTSEDQAKEVVFGDIKARITHSKWFREKYPYDTSFKNQIRWPTKDIWILPGDSLETSFEGYNILGGILDEADSHKVTKAKDYAEEGYNTISSRISSRFQNRGFMLVIGQMKKANGFASRKLAELEKDPEAYTIRMSIWESFGWDKYLDADGNRDSFFYDPKRKNIIPRGAGELLDDDTLIEIPKIYVNDFLNNPEKALRDLAGIPPAVGDPFISLTYKVEEARDRWIARHGEDSPYVDGKGFRKEFRALDSLPRACHIDMAFGGGGDALGFAMGHVHEMVENEDGELKPYVIIDCLVRLSAPAGNEIFIGDIRRLVYELRDDRKFKIRKVTLDGFQCLAGDTDVPLLDGRTLTMKELAKQYPDGGVYTYSYDGDKIVPGEVSKAWKTGKKKVVTVTLDNDEQVRCTADHPWMRRDGSYTEAKDLKFGDSLMPLLRRVTPDDWKGLKGYEQVRQPRDSARGGRKWQYTHRMVCDEYVPEDHVIHHKDVDKLNNNPDNLEVMSVDDHLAWHKANGASFGDLWRDPEFRAKTSAAVSKSNTDRIGRESRRFRHDVEFEDLIPFAKAGVGWRDVQAETGWSQDTIYARVREAGFDGWKDLVNQLNPSHMSFDDIRYLASTGLNREEIADKIGLTSSGVLARVRRAGYVGWKDFATASNHRVVSVEDTGETIDVYDLQVEEHHNFAIGAGVFVHNSTDTRQQFLRKRIDCEHVSVDKTLVPYYDLRDALYENRIEFPKYIVTLRAADVDKVEILYKELVELEDNGNKVDHPSAVMASKDVADAVAGVVYTLIGDRTYQRRTMRMNTSYGQPQPQHARRLDGGYLEQLPSTAPIPDPALLVGASQWNPPKRKAGR